MSDELSFISREGIQKIKDAVIGGALGEIKAKLSEMDIKVAEQPKKEAPVFKAEPRYDGLEIANKMTDLYKSNIKEKKEEEEKSELGCPQPVTIASKVNARALANALVGIRNGGDAGRSVALAGPNGGNVGIGTCGPTVGVMAMSVEEYEEHINQMFLVEDEEEEKVEQEPELLVETVAVTVLEDALLQLEDISWQSIDKVMRQICVEHGLTPKQLHKDFKTKHGMIPDEWAKQHEMTEEVGWYPLDEMSRIFESIGGVYEVVFMFRGGRQRLKFYWPSPEPPTEEDMQDACEKFWPGARLLTFYLAHEDPGNYSSTMVIVPAVTENFEVLPDDLWDFMSEEDSEIFNDIATEVGEPVSPVYLTEDEDEFEVDVADHDTGEIKTVLFGEGKKGLWDNIHAKRNRGEKASKPGDKDYPKTLNVEGLEDARDNVGASSCWKGYKAKGTKKKGGKEVPNCVKEADMTGAPSIKDAKPQKKTNVKYDKHMKTYAPTIKEGDEMDGMSQKSGDKRSTDSGAGMTSKGVAKYNRRTGGNLKTAVTTPPSKLKAGSKAAGRRKSFCARSRGWNGERGKAARRRWNC